MTDRGRRVGNPKATARNTLTGCDHNGRGQRRGGGSSRDAACTAGHCQRLAPRVLLAEPRRWRGVPLVGATLMMRRGRECRARKGTADLEAVGTPPRFRRQARVQAPAQAHKPFRALGGRGRNTLGQLSRGQFVPASPLQPPVDDYLSWSGYKQLRTAEWDIRLQLVRTVTRGPTRCRGATHG